jgi:hypothetical protein
MLQLLREAMNLVHQALREGRRNDATQLYHGNDGDSLATEGALLSAWSSFAGQLDAEAELPETVTMPELAARFIHKTYNRWRRKKRRDDQMNQQTARGQTRDADGASTPLDFADHRQPEELKNLSLELGEVIKKVLGTRSVRDRLVIELWIEGHTYEVIVERVQAALPKARISPATVQRIVERFRDEMRGELGGA